MSAALKDALNNCLINFDRRVNVTDLLQKYELNYEDLHKTLAEHLEQQESKGVKYAKRFLVQGVEKENNTEIYTVVQGESKLQEWLQRLQQAEAKLYSVEIEGGAKSPAYAFKPVEHHAVTLQSLTVQAPKMKFQPAPLTNGSATSAAAEKVEQKPLTKKPTAMSMFAKQLTTSSSTSKTTAAEQSKQTSPSDKKSTSPIKKTSPDAKKPSPVESKAKKGVSSTPVSKKGINNFFGAATSAATKKQEIKEEPKANTPPKQTEKLKKQKKPNKIKEEPSTSKKAASPPKSVAKVKANTSVQLFAEDSSDSSADEKEEPIALTDVSFAESRKRTRILDSEDEDDAKEPPQKVEKRESSSEMEVVDINEEDVQPKSETFLDEEGFVITIKPKKTNAPKSSNKKSTKARSPRKTPTKAQATKSQTSSKPAAAAKTKQGNIMNFFGKK